MNKCFKNFANYFFIWHSYIINFDPMPETRGANLALRRRTATLTDSEFEDLVNRVRAAQAENPVRTGIGGSGHRALEDLERILIQKNYKIFVHL